jgi:hypothetical protein
MDKKLTPGAEARVFRAGDLTQPVGGGLLVPDDGSQLAVRHLEPGDYVAVDSCGQKVAFSVVTDGAEADTTYVDVKGSKPVPEGEALEPDADDLEASHELARATAGAVHAP